MKTAIVVFAVVLFASAVTLGEEITPSENAQKLFDSLYGAEFQRVLASKETNGKVVLAEKLLVAANKADSIPELQVLLCEKVIQLSMAEPKGYDKALSAIEILVSKSPDKAQTFQETVLKIRKYQYEAGSVSSRAKAAGAYADCLVSTAIAKVRQGETEEAKKLCVLAQRLARENRLSDTESLDVKIKYFEEAQKTAAKISQLEGVIKANPANTKARDELIRILLVDQDNPVEALKYLNDTSEEKARKYLPIAAGESEEISEALNVEIGQWYYDLAGQAGFLGKAAMLNRAKSYYERFLLMHPTKDQSQTIAELALDSIKSDLAKTASAAKAAAASGNSQWVDLLKLIDPTKNVVLGKCVQEEGGIRLTGDWRRLVVPPVVVSGNYDLEVTFVNKNSEGRLGLLLPVGNTAVDLWLGSGNDNQGADFGIEMINGKENTQVKPNRLENNRPYTVLVQVRTAGNKVAIASFLDGSPLIQWSGLVSAISLKPHWKCLEPQHLGLGAYCMNVHLQKARIQLLSGKTASAR